MNPVTYRPIGVIHTPFTDIDGMPIQPTAAVGIRGTIDLDPRYADGLLDLDGFSHLILLYHLHEVRAARLRVTPFLDVSPNGVFATRSPARPNPVGLSTVRLVGIHGSMIEIEDVDMLDGTPLLDIKPYVPAFDDRAGASIGWLTGRLDRLAEVRADRRFGRGSPAPLQASHPVPLPTDAKMGTDTARGSARMGRGRFDPSAPQAARWRSWLTAALSDRGIPPNAKLEMQIRPHGEVPLARLFLDLNWAAPDGERHTRAVVLVPLRRLVSEGWPGWPAYVAGLELLEALG
jgi:tRNA-Thr(GGU) m(6)t(6)A37 methyltransferase TsaA